VNPAAAHVLVLGNGNVGVAQMIGPDTCRQSFVVDQGGKRLAETVRGDVGRPQSGVKSVARSSPAAATPQ